MFDLNNNLKKYCSGALHHSTRPITEPEIPFGDLLKKPLSLPITRQDDHSRFVRIPELTIVQISMQADDQHWRKVWERIAFEKLLY